VKNAGDVLQRMTRAIIDGKVFKRYKRIRHTSNPQHNKQAQQGGTIFPPPLKDALLKKN
jgi:hypothetical protein